MVLETGIVHLVPVPLYVGPDAFLPLTSALAAIAGAVMLFWLRLVAFFHRIWLSITKKRPAGSETRAQGD